MNLIQSINNYFVLRRAKKRIFNLGKNISLAVLLNQINWTIEARKNGEDETLIPSIGQTFHMVLDDLMAQAAEYEVFKKKFHLIKGGSK